MSMHLKIGCIGTRDIDQATTNWLNLLGEQLIKSGHSILSGNATGSDQAYVNGAIKVSAEKVILFLPWSTYNKESIPLGVKIVENPLPAWNDLARRHHPIYDSLKRGAKSMMHRNAGIILCSDIVLAMCSSNHSGGTAHGWSCSEELKKPRLNLTTISHDEKGLEEVLEWVDEQRVRRLMGI